jgi:hypothetical protein
VRGERGSVMLLTVVLGSLGLTGAVGLVLVAVDLGVASARARVAADAAALAAVQASPVIGGDGERSAHAAAAAAANGARMSRCAEGPPPGWPWTVDCEVAVVPQLRAVRALAPPLRARAAAALTPAGVSGARGPP